MRDSIIFGWLCIITLMLFLLNVAAYCTNDMVAKLRISDIARQKHERLVESKNLEDTKYKQLVAKLKHDGVIK